MQTTVASHRVSLTTLLILVLLLVGFATTPAWGQTPELVAEQTSEIFLDQDGSGGITAGDLIEYNVTITNIGTGDDLSVVFDEIIGDGAALESGSVVVNGGDVSLGNNDEDPQVIVEAEMLPSATSMTISFQARVDFVLQSDAESVTNQGVVTSSLGHPSGIGTDDPATPEVADATVVELKRPDLLVSVADAGGAVEAGGLLVYEVNYENVGSSHAEASSVTETVPLLSTYNAAASSAGWDCADGAPAGTVCTYEIGFMDIGDSGSLDFAVDVSELVIPGVSQLINVAAIGDDGTHGLDEDATNNLSIVVTSVGSTADISLEVTPLLDPVMAGAQQVYEFVVTNHGPLAVTGISLDYDLPDDVEYMGSDPGDPDCLEAAGAVTCLVSSLAVDETVSIFVLAHVSPFFEGTLSASASVDSDQADSSLANNTVEVSEQVDPVMIAETVPDFSGNGIDEIAVFTYNDGVAKVSVNDAETGEQLTSFSLSSEYMPIDLEVVPNFDGTGADELALLAKDPIGGKSRLFLRDAGDGSVLSSRGLTASYVPYDLEVIPDMNGSGGDELAILEIDPVTGTRRITVKDPEPSSTLLTINLDSDSTPYDMERTSDGRIAVISVLADNGASVVSFYDELDGSDLGEISYPAGWSSIELEIMADIDDNDADELVVLMRQNSPARNRVFVTDSVTADETRMSVDKNMVARDLEIIPDFEDSSADEIVVSLARPDATQAKIWVKDGGSKKTLSKIFQDPEWIAHDLAIVSDFGSTSADEVVIHSMKDGVLEIRIKDADSRAKLTNYKPF